jgi:hypothetical protein
MIFVGRLVNLLDLGLKLCRRFCRYLDRTHAYIASLRELPPPPLHFSQNLGNFIAGIFKDFVYIFIYHGTPTILLLALILIMHIEGVHRFLNI